MPVIREKQRMLATTIPIRLDADAARFYTAASPEIQNKLQILLSVWLREIASSTSVLSACMDEISANAEARGLTPDTLAALLQDD